MGDVPAIESVDRALRLLQVLGERGSGATLEEVAGAAGLPKSSAHRTLAALRERRFASQQDDGRYMVGPELLRVAFEFYERMDLRVAMRPVLERLHREVNETVHLGVLDGGDVVYLDKLEPTHPIRLSSRVGGRIPAHCTGVGKALLAWTYPTDDAIRGWIEERGTLEVRTPRSITSPPARGARDEPHPVGGLRPRSGGERARRALHRRAVVPGRRPTPWRRVDRRAAGTAVGRPHALARTDPAPRDRVLPRPRPSRRP